SRILRLVFRGKNLEKVVKAAASAADRLGKALPSSAEILGPAECPLSTISGNSRHQLIIRTKDFSSAHTALSGFLRSNKPASGIYIEVDIDPVSLL
ncbi:MAG: primosomal protein N', partial [Spirochaetales bacterium]|nr:primosomal protein N' [Spirochaetales bacterium]